MNNHTKQQVNAIFQEFEKKILQLEQKEFQQHQEILLLKQQLQEQYEQIQEQDKLIKEQKHKILVQQQQIQGKSANLIYSLDNVKQMEEKIKDLEQIIIKYKEKPVNFQGKNLPNFNCQEFDCAIFQAQKIDTLNFIQILSHKDIRIEDEGKKIVAGSGKINALLNFIIGDYVDQITYFKIIIKFGKYLGIGVYQEENGFLKYYNSLQNFPKFTSSCWINDTSRYGVVEPQGQLDCNVNKEIELTIIYNDAGKASKDVSGTWRLGFELFNQNDYLKIV